VTAKARGRRPAARAAAVAAPSAAFRARALARFAPSRRSLAVGIGILVLAACAYALARETSLFAIRAVDVDGGSARVDAQVQQALAPLVGTSLVGLDGAEVTRRVDSLPTVVSVTFDRAFPDTLRVTVVPERPVAVLRRGGGAWLVSARGRVMTRLADPHAHAHLPRIWVDSHTAVALGVELPPAKGGVAARALALAGAFAARVGSASYSGGILAFRLRSGVQLRLGSAGGVRLKVAVTRRALPVLPTGTGYLDVSVPGRPVAGSGTEPVIGKSQVSTGGRG
jgi:cell division protein FtsQ